MCGFFFFRQKRQYESGLVFVGSGIFLEDGISNNGKLWEVKGNLFYNSKKYLGKCKDDMIILHPLPRVDEIDTNLDNTKYALYFKQAKNGIPVRQAMMMTVLGKDKEFFL